MSPRPGQGANISSLEAAFLMDGWTGRELREGVVFAAARGWVEIDERRVVLTGAGKSETDRRRQYGKGDAVR